MPLPYPALPYPGADAHEQRSRDTRDPHQAREAPHPAPDRSNLVERTARRADREATARSPGRFWPGGKLHRLRSPRAATLAAGLLLDTGRTGSEFRSAFVSAHEQMDRAPPPGSGVHRQPEGRNLFRRIRRKAPEAGGGESRRSFVRRLSPPSRKHSRSRQVLELGGNDPPKPTECARREAP